MGDASYAVLLLGTGQEVASASLPLQNVSAAFKPTDSVCARDLYTGELLPVLPPGAPLVAALPAHDSVFYCAWPAGPNGACDGANDCP